MVKSPPVGGEIRRLRWWNLWITTPALLVVWIAGLHLALEAGWFASLWLQLKLACVAGLSLIHFWQAYRLGHADRDPDLAAVGGWLPLLISSLVAAIF